MPLTHVHPDLVAHALKRVKGGAFEDFAQDILAALIGPKFVPMGGTGDGGADGFIGDRIFEDGADAQSFMQASVQAENVTTKIKATVERLRAFRRDPKHLRYVTSHAIPALDRIENDLTGELNVSIRILDGKYLATHINDSSQTIAAFENHLRPVTEYLRVVGSAPVIAKSKHVESPAVYVFLRQEVERRSGNTSLVDAVTDALILWSLDGTDPDTGKLMTKTEISDKICSTVPFAKDFINTRLNDRLAHLSAKARDSGRVRWHRQEDRYALPHKTREEIAVENAEDDNLRLAVLDSLQERITAIGSADLKEGEMEFAGEIALRALQLLFEQEGLELASYIARNEATTQNNLETVQDAVRTAIEESGLKPARIPIVGDNVLGALRGVFYASSEQERLYLGKLSRTYSLLFTLKTEPRLISYFQEMAGDFHLYVGTDILVRALSERYLEPKDQMTRNVLRMAAEAGATLVLAEPVLEEVIGHMRASDKEYEVNFAPLGDIEFRIAETMSPKILVRTYYHALANPDPDAPRLKSWAHFVSQFVDHSQLRTKSGQHQLKGYLTNEFNMVFESNDDLEEIVDHDELVSLASSLTAVKDDREGSRFRARADALMVLAVYGKRKQLGEHKKSTEFGMRTWWMTSETRILSRTGKLVADHGGNRFMMRPEYLLNFLALAPSAADVRTTYANIFPTVLGVKLSRRLDEAVFHDLMAKVLESEEIDPGRRKSQIADNADRLKSDFYKEYLRGFTGP